jgi:hypothetical protein
MNRYYLEDDWRETRQREAQYKGKIIEPEKIGLI